MHYLGDEYTDTVTLGDLTIESQGVGVALIAFGFDGVDGILGYDLVLHAGSDLLLTCLPSPLLSIGPVDLTEGTTSSGDPVPTVLDNALAQGLIDAELVGVSFEPTNDLSVTNGELTFGAVDDSKYTGDIAYVPVTSTSPASAYVGIDQSITYGSAGTTVLASTAGITDTGTTLVLIASGTFCSHCRSGFSLTCVLQTPWRRTRA